MLPPGILGDKEISLFLVNIAVIWIFQKHIKLKYICLKIIYFLHSFQNTWAFLEYKASNNNEKSKNAAREDGSKGEERNKYMRKFRARKTSGIVLKTKLCSSRQWNVEEDETDYFSLYHGILSISQIYILSSYCEPKTISCIKQR